MDEPNGAWMTKAELALVRGISVASAYRLIRRQGWRRQPGNDGKVRVLVPTDWAAAHDPDPTAIPEDIPTDRPSDGERLVLLLEAANVRADEANKRASDALALADRTLAQLADAGTRADVAGKRADRAEARAVQAEQARDQARDAHQGTLQALRRMEAAEAERKARGRLRRAWQAWRGE
jgi:hypothetical protein